MILKIQMLAIDSSNLQTLKFNHQSETGQLARSTKGYVDVEFKNGTRYRYVDVLFGDFLDVMFAESKGQMFYFKISKVYSYEKM
jgi:hypothetical protein